MNAIDINEILSRILLNAGQQTPLDILTMEIEEAAMEEDTDGYDSSTPRRETIFNQFLPYADQLEEEAKLKLTTIKSNLVKAVLCRELKPGCYYWTMQLNSYIVTYGRKFSKEDHIAFIHLLYELVTIPNLEFFLLDIFARVLTALLKKKELISREDLVIPWRPLYNIYQRLSPQNKLVKRTLIRIPNQCLVSVQSLIKVSRIYFPAESTQEMLDEWRPMFCPYVRIQMSRAMQYFEIFLPTVMFPEEHKHTFKLWFDEFMQIWDSCHNTPAWEASIVNLFSRLAETTVGYIDWNPYIPMISTRLLRSFHLPVYMKQVRFQSTKEHYNLNAVAILFVSMLGSNSSCQTHLNQLFKGLESFYHPSNSGIWNNRLQQFIAKLTDSLVKRLKREKKPMKSWEPRIPASHHLTDEEITTFVKCVQPCIMLSMFSKSGCYDASIAFKNLAVLRPELIVPPILEKFYPATETLIEPHRLLAVVQCLAYVALPMVKGGKHLPDGPTHVLPILLSSLPGIDPNDTHKTLATFQLIACLVTLVPLIDCSQDVQNHEGLTEMERDLCSATSQFEDFVFQFMDRCFHIIENASLESSLSSDHVKEGVSPEIVQLQYCITSVFNLILNQCSPQLQEAAVGKLTNFVTGRILGIKDSGYLAAKLVSATTSKVNAKWTLKKMLPTICNIVEENCPDATTSSTNTDQELLFNMLLLQELVCCDGLLLLQYREIIFRVLKKTVKLSNKEVRNITCQTIKNLLTSLTSTFFLEQSSIDPADLEGILPIKVWGSTIETSKLRVSWHTGTQDELEFAQELVNTLLGAEMEKLNNVKEGNTTLTREELRQSLATIHAVLIGCLSRCPLWEESSIPLLESCTHLEIPSSIIQSKDAGVITLNGKNLRSQFVNWLQKLTGYLLKNHEDNIAVFRFVIKIYHHLMFYWGSQESCHKDYKYANLIRKILDNPMKQKKHQFRYLLIHRVNLQHQMRVVGMGANHFSTLHQSIMCDLLNLATNHYSEIRILSQWVLGECYIHLPFSYRSILPQLEELVKNNKSYTHDQLKGLLHVLLGEQHSYCLLVRRDWEMACKLWPVILTTPISDLPSVNMLLDSLVNRVSKQFETFAIEEEFPQSVLNKAHALVSASPDEKLNGCPATEEEIRQGVTNLRQIGDRNLKNYNSLIKEHISLLQTPNLHWQSFQLGVGLLTVLVRHDVRLPVEAVQLILHNLLNDSTSVRFLAMKGLAMVLQQHRPQCVYTDVDPKDLNGKNGENVYYEESIISLTPEQWDQTIFMDQPHLGFYCWPKKLNIHAPPEKQAVRFKARDQMSEIEGVIYDFFMSKPNMESLIKFMSAEISKEKDKLEIYKCDLIKQLFRNYGDLLLPVFTPHIEPLIKGSLDSQKRCALEIMFGMIAGSKHWNYSKLLKLWEILLPLMKLALSGVTIELQSDWNRAINFIVESTDPRRLKWLLELLLEDFLGSKDGSFVEANRLFLLFTFLSEHSWKISNVLDRILKMITPYLAHPYQNIRDELGRLLGLIFLINVDARPFKNGHPGPSQIEFINALIPKLEIFEKAVISSTLPYGVESPISISEDDPEWKESVALLKTICRWLRRRLGKTLQIMSSEIIQLLPLLCLGETCDRDPELQNSCRLAIAVLGQAYIAPDLIPLILQTVDKLSKSNSWRVRKTALEYLQVLVFSNLFSFLQRENCIGHVTEIVLKLLEDSRPEVQQMAATTLSGMFHCNILTADKHVLNNFMKLSKTPIKNVSNSGLTNGEAIQRRHAGILGMTAYVRAHPYDIAEGMPEILVALGSHLHDPQPLQTTVRHALTNFWRTHHDNWVDHKFQFTEDQLADITDLLVSPNYYA